MCAAHPDRPAFNIKRQECRQCHGARVRDEHRNGKAANSINSDRVTVGGLREGFYAGRHLTAAHIYEPARFDLGEFGTYTPDFYDPTTGRWIEVIGSRQAYYYNRAKYAAFRQRYPSLSLAVVWWQTGEPYDDTQEQSSQPQPIYVDATPHDHVDSTLHEISRP